MLSVRKLIETLQTINNPEARVILMATPRDREADNGNGTCHGDVAQIAVARIDGTDTLVTLTNCIADAKGNPVFNVPTQFNRFVVSTTAGIAQAAADLEEQVGSEPTTDLDNYLEAESFKRMLNDLQSLGSQPQS